MIIDHEEVLHPLDDKIYEMYSLVRENFKLIESHELDYVWFYYKNTERSKAESWGKNYIEVYERIE